MKNILATALVLNGLLALAYRAVRHRRGGPIVDVYGGMALLLLLLVLAAGVFAELAGMRWVGFGYAALFAVVVTPIWVLAVVIPARPDTFEKTLVAAYWLSLAAIAVAALWL